MATQEDRTNGDGLTLVREQAKTLADEATILEEKAKLVEAMARDKERIKEAKQRIGAVSGGGMYGLGKILPRKNAKLILIVVGTLVLFAIIKMAGC